VQTVQKAHEGRIFAALVAGELPPIRKISGSGKAIPPGQPRAISILRHDVSSLALSLDAFERRGARRTFWIE
jgi:hypothetical protein